MSFPLEISPFFYDLDPFSSNSPYQESIQLHSDHQTESPLISNSLIHSEDFNFLPHDSDDLHLSTLPFSPQGHHSLYSQICSDSNLQVNTPESPFPTHSMFPNGQTSIFHSKTPSSDSLIPPTSSHEKYLQDRANYSGATYASSNSNSSIDPEFCPQINLDMDIKKFLSHDTILIPSPLSLTIPIKSATDFNHNCNPCISLVHSDLWNEFNGQYNEMIVTKAGRCLFPTFKIGFEDLEPEVVLSVQTFSSFKI